MQNNPHLQGALQTIDDDKHDSKANFNPSTYVLELSRLGDRHFQCWYIWSISQAKVYQLKLAYKLALGSALFVVQKVSDILGKSAGRLPIASHQKSKIKRGVSL